MPTFIGVQNFQSSIGPAFQRAPGVQGAAFAYLPIGNATTVHTPLGVAALTSVGTATARNVANTNTFTTQKRLGIVSAGTAGAFADQYSPTAQILRSTSVGQGGFDITMEFGQSDAAVVADARGFFGLLASTSALTNVEPNTLTNMVGIGFGAADTNFQVYCNDGSGTATAIDLGPDFPAKTTGVDWYRVRFVCSQDNPGVINVEVIRMRNDGLENAQQVTLTRDLPASGTFLGVRAFKTNNATAAAVAFDLGTISGALGV